MPLSASECPVLACNGMFTGSLFITRGGGGGLHWPESFWNQYHSAATTWVAGRYVNHRHTDVLVYLAMVAQWMIHAAWTTVGHSGSDAGTASQGAWVMTLARTGSHCKCKTYRHHTFKMSSLSLSGYMASDSCRAYQRPSRQNGHTGGVRSATGPKAQMIRSHSTCHLMHQYHHWHAHPWPSRTWRSE